MGGTSGVLTGDTREEVIEKAKRWYVKALNFGLFPRDEWIYGKGDVEITFRHCKSEECPWCGGQPLKARVIIVDRTKRPPDAESEYPFPLYSRFLSEEAKHKRYFCFVSAHS